MAQAIAVTATATGNIYQAAKLATATFTKDTTANNDFTIDFQAIESLGSKRGMELRISVNQTWTNTPVCAFIKSGQDGTNFETFKKYADDATAAAVPSLTNNVETVYIVAHDFRYLLLNTTGGKASATFDGFTVSLWNRPIPIG